MGYLLPQDKYFGLSITQIMFKLKNKFKPSLIYVFLILLLSEKGRSVGGPILQTSI